MGKDDKQNVKAIYRRAQAQHGLKNFNDSIEDCKKVVELDPQNREARELLKKARAGQKEIDKQAKGMFNNMCKALGKLTTPQTAGTKRPHEDAEPTEPIEKKQKQGETTAKG